MDGKEKMTGEPRGKKKRALSITSFGVIALIAIIVANAVVWAGYRGKCAEVSSLTDEISRVYQSIKETPRPPEGLEARLETAKTELAAAKKALPDAVRRNDVIDYILSTAEECQVQIIPLVSEGWVTDNSHQSYRILKLNGTVTGSLEQATNFISELQDGKYPTMTITELTVERLSGPDISNSENSVQVSVSLSIVLYIYSPAASEDTVL